METPQEPWQKLGFCFGSVQCFDAKLRDEFLTLGEVWLTYSRYPSAAGGSFRMCPTVCRIELSGEALGGTTAAVGEWKP